MNLLVVIPCLNEEVTIADVIKRVPKKIEGFEKIDILVVDDGSTDNTAIIADRSGAKVISHKINKGVGAAFNSGVNFAIKHRYDIMVNMDGDGQFDAQDIVKIVNPLLSMEADFVSASRFYDASVYPEMSKIKFIGNKLMSQFISRLTKKKFFDVSCGFRAYTRDTLLKLNLFGKFTYTQETFINLALKDVAIREVPLKIQGTREHGKSRVASNLFKYAFNTLKIILKTYRDYKPFQLFGWLASILFVCGFGLGVFLLSFYLRNNVFTPHKWAGFASAFFLASSSILLFVGFILDMIARLRKNQETILYLLKK